MSVMFNLVDVIKTKCLGSISAFLNLDSIFWATFTLVTLLTPGYHTSRHNFSLKTYVMYVTVFVT